MTALEINILYDYLIELFRKQMKNIFVVFHLQENEHIEAVFIVYQYFTSLYCYIFYLQLARKEEDSRAVRKLNKAIQVSTDFK